MTNFEARIRTKVGEIIVHFQNKDDLQKKIQLIQDFINIINKSGLVLAETKTDTRFEKIYNLSVDGLPRLLKIPKSKSDTIRLLLFISHNPLDARTIAKLSGIKKPQDYMKDSDHFVKMADGTYTLNPEGKRRVSEIIIPQLLAEGETPHARS